MKNTAMKNTSSAETDKIRTTLYLTPENKQGLDKIPRGQKTALMNRAIAAALKELEKKQNSAKFLEMIKAIQPVRSEQSSESMIQHLREKNERSTHTNDDHE